MHAVCRVILAAVVALALPRATHAQESVTFGSVSGRVTDADGGVIPGVTVSAREAATKAVTAVTTDREGRYRFSLLRPGTYEVAASIAGFATATRRVAVSAGSAFDLPFTLKPGGATEIVVISDEAALVETSRTQSAVTLAINEIRNLPLNGRNFLDLALFVPGVSPTNVGGGTQLFPETSALPGVGLSIASQRNLSNNFMVDGLSANDDAAALAGVSFAVDAVQDFQVVTSGGQAELGRALGGYINITTRAGTNFRHLDGYSFFRDDRFDGKNALSGTKLPLHQNQFGGSLGGPIKEDRAWYFVNLERRQLDQSGLTTISPANVAAINGRLAAVGYGGPAVTTGIYANPIDTTHALVRTDQFLSDASKLMVKYSAYKASSQNARGAGGTTAPSASAGLENLDQSVSAGNTLVTSRHTVIEMRGQIAHGDLEAPPSDSVGPSVSIAGVAAFGRLSSSPTARTNTMYQAVANVFHVRGAHSFKGGLDLLYNDDTITFPRATRGAYTFSSLANFLNGVYNTNGFTQTFGDTVVAQTNPNLGIYVQDDWRVRPRVTVNAGLRYDLQVLETVRTDTNNVSPRAGIAWALDESGRTVVRASGGRFYDRVPLRAVANALLSAGNTTDLANLRQISVTLSPGQTGAPAFPNVLAAIVPSTTLVNLTTIDRNLQNAHSNQFAAEFERQLTASAAVSLGYQYLRGGGLLMQINQNAPTCAAAGSNNGCRPVAAYANNNQYSAAGRSVYHGLHLSLVQRPTKWGSYRVSYTYSKSMNNLGETFFASPLDPANVDLDWGRSDDDQRHRLVVNAAISSPSAPARSLADHMTRGWQLSGALQCYSALPFNITTGANTVQGTAARPQVGGRYIERNSGSGSAFLTSSLRLVRQFNVGANTRLEALVEAFNVFNRRNDIARVTVFGTGAFPGAPAANYNQITVVGDPRSIQFGFRVKF